MIIPTSTTWSTVKRSTGKGKSTGKGREENVDVLVVDHVYVCVYSDAAV